MAAFHLLQVFSGWRLQLPLTFYSCLLFFVGQLPKLLCLRSFTGEMIPHPTQIWLFPHHVPHSSPVRLLFHHLPPLHIWQWFFSFCLQVFLETLLTQVGRVCFIAFIHHYRRQLPVAGGLFTALSVTTKQRLLRNACRPRYENPFFLFLLRTPSFFHMILCFFGFHPNHFFEDF